MVVTRCRNRDAGKTETPAVDPAISNREEENTSLVKGNQNDEVSPNSQERLKSENVALKHRSGFLKIGIWNVRTMYEAGKLENCTKEMREHKVDILGAAEVRWLDSGEFSKGDYVMYFSGGKKHRNGVGVLMAKRIAKAVQGYWPISERVIMIKPEAKPFDLVIVQVYAPTSEYSEEELEDFYEDVQKAINQTKSTDIVYIIGDMNAKIGKGKEEQTVGHYGLGERNERGDRMVQFCKENELVVTNTFFKQHPRRVYAWQSPGDMYRNQIDYIMIKQRYKNSIKNVQTYPGADVNSDHCLLVAKMKLRLKIPKKSTRKMQVDLNALKEEETRKAYAVEVKNRYNILRNEEMEQLPEESEIEQEWRCIKQSIKQAAEEVLPPRKNKKSKEWMTEEILDMMEERKRQNEKTEYNKIDKKIKAQCKKEKDKWYNQMCEEIERLENKHDMNRMHQAVKELTDRKKEIKTNSGCVRAKDGTLLFEREKVAERWTEYIRELYDDENRGDPVELEDTGGPDILIEEVKAAIKHLKNGKAAGIDEIKSEHLKALDEDSLEHITQLCNNIYNTGEIPKDLRHSLFIKLPKKPKAMDCSDYRTISLMSHVMKIVLKILIDRNTNTIEREIGETQSGFRQKIGTREGIFNLRTVFDRYLEVHKEVYICFIDYEKAFDRVYHSRLIEILKTMDIDGKDIRLIQNLYWEQVAAIRLEEGYSEEFAIKRGVRQGCILSPKFFNSYAEKIFRRIEHLKGVNIGGRNINNLRFADDTALIADSQDLQKIVDAVCEISAEYGLRMNTKKTKVMVVTRSEEQKAIKITVNGEELEQVKQFKYLGQLITENGKCDVEVKRRIEIAKTNFIKMRDVLASRKLTLATRKRLARCYVLSTLLYAAETWTISKEVENRIEAFEMWMYRKMLRISYQDHKTNEEVLRMVNEKRSLLHTIKRRKCTYFGHVIRGNGLQRQILEGKVEGVRRRGRPRRTWAKDVLEWMDMNYGIAVNTAQKRGKWHAMASKVQDEQGTR